MRQLQLQHHPHRQRATDTKHEVMGMGASHMTTPLFNWNGNSTLLKPKKTPMQFNQQRQIKPERGHQIKVGEPALES
jgi:hypothetical protein